jgi:hypothetical protein
MSLFFIVVEVKTVPPADTAAGMHVELEAILKGKCGSQAGAVIDTFNRMRDVVMAESAGVRYTFDFYAGPNPQTDVAVVMDDLASLCGVGIFSRKTRLEDPPETLDSVRSLRNKIKLANALDWTRQKLF